MGKGKKSRKQDDDWEDDFNDLAKEQGIEVIQTEDIVQVTKKDKKKKKGKVAESTAEEENEGAEVAPIRSGFSALTIEDDDGDNVDFNSLSDDETPVVENKPKENMKKKKKKETAEEAEVDEILSNLEKPDDNSQKKSKKNKKKKNREPEDIDIELDENNENESAPVEDNAEKVDDDSDKKGKKGKKKKKKEVNYNDLLEDGENKVEGGEKTENKDKEVKTENGEEGTTIKTAAQKKAEKKERDKKKKEADKKKKMKKEAKTEEVSKAEEANTEDTKVEDDVPKEPEKKEEDTLKDDEQKDEEEDGESGEEEGASKDKKKKKKKKKKGDDDDKKKTKKPGKAAIIAMQAALEEVKREEERLQAEAEAKAKALEEAEDRRLEKLRLEKERKEKKKQKDKERKERMKREGKLLTPAQREQRRKAEAMLESMKQQGIIIPKKEDTGEKPKKVMYGKKKKQPNQQQKVEQPVEPPPLVIEEPPKQEEVKKEVKVKKKDEEDVADDWGASEGLDAPADSWDADDKELKPAPKMEAPKLKKQVSTTKSEVSTKSDEHESESEGSEDDSEEESESESESESGSSEEESSSEEEDVKLTPAMIKQRARERIQKRRVANEEKRSTDKLRAPVICVLGHVDTGKTKILDKIRHTNVQDGEAGGITQQIGATNIPVHNIREQTKMVKEFQKFDLKLPGLLIIDTPGHESFSNLRSRGSNLCDMAILVVDLMHGLEQQTIESINLLKSKKTPFVVALNKIDRVYEWKKGPQTQVQDTLKAQKKQTTQAFQERFSLVLGQFAEQGLNVALHFDNPDEKSYISLVPTSAHSGDGMGDLLALICRLTQTRLAKKLAFSEELESTVMEVKALPGLGTTIDVILVNGRIKEGETLVTGGIEGAIVTQIRSVLTPQPMRELRVKAQYIHHQEIEAAQGVKLCGKDLEKVLAGSPVYIAKNPDEVEVLREDVEHFVSSSLKAIKVSERGVYVQASTLGSLEALLEFLKTSKIPYCGVNIGPVHKKDIMRCSVMLAHEPLYAVVLAFDVKIEKDAQDFADKEGVKIFSAEIIYHLFDQFTAYTEDYRAKKREEFAHLAVYPVKLRILPQHIFNTRDPIVFGVIVDAGTLRIGTPIIVPSQNCVMIGFVTGIEANHKQIDKANQGMEVCVKIDSVPGEAPKLYGRHFTHEDMLISRINRESIDVLKQYFREDMQKSDWQLIIELKKLLEIV